MYGGWREGRLVFTIPKVVRRALLWLGGLAVLAVVGGQPVGAQGTEGLVVSFESIELPQASQPPPLVSDVLAGGGSARYVGIDADSLLDDLQGADSIELEIFDGVRFPLTTDEARAGVAGSRFWAGSGAGVVATFTELDGSVEGRIVDTSTLRLYRVLPVGGSAHVIAQDRTDYQNEMEIESPTADEPEATTPGQGAGDDDEIAADVEPRIDVLVWYDSAAISLFGSTGATRTAIVAAINETNAAADRSGAIVDFDLVELEFVSWTPPSNPSLALGSIRNQGDGLMDEVHAARDAAGADLVAVIGNLAGGCGIGYVAGSNQGPVRSDLAFTYTDGDCIGGNLSLAHEIGHNLGAHHDIGASSPGPGPYPYAQGFVNQAGGYRTIMSYTTACIGCLRVPYFSGPTATYQGNPTGDAGKDNARTITENAAMVAGYRTIAQAPAAVTAADLSLAEGDAGIDTVRVVFQLDRPAVPAGGSGVASMRVTTTDGTATVADNDYRSLSQVVEWGPGETTTFVDVEIVGDTTPEDDETFTLALTEAALVDVGDGSVDVTIENDDGSLTPTVRAASQTVTETERNQAVRIAVTLDRPAEQTVRVRYTTMPGTALRNSDYLRRSGIVTIPRGQTSRNATVIVKGDLVEEPTEAFTVVLSNPIGATLAGDSDATITILDNDDPPPIVDAISQTVTETDRNQVVRVTFELSQPAAATTRVRYRTNSGTATAGSDFANRRGTVVFARGQTTKTVNITIRGGRVPEGTEQFTVDLENPIGLAIGSSATITILDND